MHIQDVAFLLLFSMMFNLSVVVAAAVLLYTHFTDLLGSMEKTQRRLRKRLEAHEEASKKYELINPQVEETPPPLMPPIDQYQALDQAFVDQVAPPDNSDFIDLVDDQKPNQPITDKHPLPSPYSTYMQAHQELWRLTNDGLDDSDKADYLRALMEECYSKLDGLERESVERESADSWKHA